MQPVHPKKECPTMPLANIELGKLSVSKANMRYGSMAPDVSDILPSTRARGLPVPLCVRPGPVPSEDAGGGKGTFEIVAGACGFHATPTPETGSAAAGERRGQAR